MRVTCQSGRSDTCRAHIHRRHALNDVEAVIWQYTWHPIDYFLYFFLSHSAIPTPSFLPSLSPFSSVRAASFTLSLNESPGTMSQNWSYSPPTTMALSPPRGISGEEQLLECEEHHPMTSASEFEAAEVLASFAKSAAVRDSGGGGGSADSWRSKGKGMSKQVKNESAAVDSGLSLLKSVPNSFDLNEVQTLSQEESEKEVENGKAKLVTTEDDAESGARGPVCTTSLGGGGKSRRNMTEAEKEAQRLRRIMANRESARQTIRRRQALYEELTKKAADLAWENANLKRDKELLAKEYQSIQSVNKNLKEKMAKALGLEVQVNHGEAAPSVSSPLFAPFPWPSSIEASRDNLSRVVPHGIAVPSTVVVPANAMTPSQNCSSSHTPRIPWFIVPCPWFLPIPNYHQLPSSHINDKQTQLSFKCKHVANPSSNTMPRGEDCSLILPLTIKVEASTSAESTFDKNVGEFPFGSSANRGLQPARCLSKVMGSSPDSVGYGRVRMPFKNGNGVDSAAAAGARKRRKELIKWKNLHSHESSIHF